MENIMKVKAGKPSMKGVQSGMAPKVIKGARSAGEKYKAPKAGMTAGSARKGGSEKSSGNVTMMKQSASDKNRYSQAKQPVQFSNAGVAKATKFIC